MLINKEIQRNVTISNLQTIGLIGGCLPGLNILTAIIKFFVYLYKETNPENRHGVEVTAAKTEELAQTAFNNDVKKVTENLKWYALVQIIPFVGIYGAYLEKETLEKISTLRTVKLNQDNESQTPTPVVPVVTQAVEPPLPEELKPIPVKIKENLLSMNSGLTLGSEKKKEICKEVNQKEFNSFLLSHPQLVSGNKTLLSNTLCKAKLLPHDINAFNVKATNDQLNQLRNLPLSEKHRKLNMRLDKGWFQYLEAHHFYIDFANATSLGGAYRSYGCVQEERMFAEFMSLALLDYITQNGLHPCIDRDGIGHTTYPPEALPYPFIVEDIYRNFDINKVPYGSDFKKANEQTIVDGIGNVENAVPVSIIGLAAVDWRIVNKEDRRYNLAQLLYHFDAAVLGNMGANALINGKMENATVHTAPWGCGAFLNSEKMLTAIQYLAARVAGVEIVFHGVGNPMNPVYNEKMIQEIAKDIEQALSEKQTPQQILEALLKKQDLDPSWAPKK